MKRTKRECYIGDDGYCHVPLQNGQESICDKIFINAINKYTWSYSNDKYAIATINGKYTKLHRFLFFLNKQIEAKFYIDHINRNRLDNRMSNLRQATPQLNTMNSLSYGKGGRYGVTKYNNRYRVQITINGKRIRIGVFDSEYEAAYHYDLFCFHYLNGVGNLNFPEKKEEYKNIKPQIIRYKNTKASSKFEGVHYSNSHHRFIAQVCINNKNKYIGSFKDDISAAKAVDLFILKNNLNKKLNFPKETYEAELNQQPKQMVLFKAS